MDDLAVQVHRHYLAMYTHLNTNTGGLSPAAAPLTPANAAPTIRQMNDSIRPCIQALMDMDHALTQELAYQQNIINMHLHIEQPPARQLLFPHITALRTRTATLAALLAGQRAAPPAAPSLRLATAALPISECESWAFRLQQKVIADLLLAPHGSPAGMPAALAALPPAATREAQRFADNMDALRALHRKFDRLAGLLAHHHALTRAFAADGSLAPWLALDNDGGGGLRAVARLRQRGVGSLRAYRPAALVEMARLQGPLQRLVSEAFRRLAPFLGGELPEQQAIGGNERRRRLTEAVQLMLRNEAQARWDRQQAAVDNMLVDFGEGGVVDADPTPQELLARIMNMAAVPADQPFLAGTWTVPAIQDYLDAASAQLLPP